MKKSKTTAIGRPQLSDEPTRRSSITMPVSYWLWLESQDRNTSAAVRALVEQAMEAEAKCN
jgi:hypothetical protein